MPLLSTIVTVQQLVCCIGPADQGSVGLGERGAPSATGCGRDCGSARHRNTVGHPSHDRCRSEQIQGPQARIHQCGGQRYRHGTQGGRTMVATGIDVSKAMLDVSIAEGPVHRFEISGSGLRCLLRHMDRAGATQAVCEATGGYERLLVSRPGAAGITVQVAHPLRVRTFTRACGCKAKTDALDARVLARPGQVFPASAPSPPERGGTRGVATTAAQASATGWTRASHPSCRRSIHPAA